MNWVMAIGNLKFCNGKGDNYYCLLSTAHSIDTKSSLIKHSDRANIFCFCYCNILLKDLSTTFSWEIQ